MSGSPPARHPRHRPTRLGPPPGPSGRACQGAHGRGAGLRAGRHRFRARLGAAGGSRYAKGRGSAAPDSTHLLRALCRLAPPSSGTARCFSAFLGSLGSASWSRDSPAARVGKCRDVKTPKDEAEHRARDPPTFPHLTRVAPTTGGCSTMLGDVPGRCLPVRTRCSPELVRASSGTAPYTRARPRSLG